MQNPTTTTQDAPLTVKDAVSTRKDGLNCYYGMIHTGRTKTIAHFDLVAPNYEADKGTKSNEKWGKRHKKSWLKRFETGSKGKNEKNPG